MRVELRSQGDSGSARFGEFALRLGDRDACILLRLQLRLEGRPHGRRLGFSRGDARQLDDEPLQRRRRIRLGQRGFERGEARLELGAQGGELATSVCRERLPERRGRRTTRWDETEIGHWANAGPIIVLVGAGK